MSGQLSVGIPGVPVFAVIDTETSGLSASAHRVVEVGVCVTDIEFAPLATWHTMINPQAPVTNSHIHGLGVEDLVRAPVFAEIAATLAGQLEGLRAIAHNAGFDARFLDAEYARLNTAFCTDPQFSWIDSLQIARQLVPTPHNLASLCTRLKITNPLPHAALGDAISTAGVLAGLRTQHASRLGEQLLATTVAYRASLCKGLPPQREAYQRGLITQLT